MVGVYRPGTLAEALSLRAGADSALVAGGTDLMVKHRALAGAVPRFGKDVILIGHLVELKGIMVTKDHVRIRAATALASILEDRDVPPYIKLPISEIGSPAIRNMGTIGGNICNASPAGDSLTMLYTLDAMLEIASERGVRNCTIGDFIKGPGQIDLGSDEILTEIMIPVGDFDRFFYRKAGQRRANAISKASFFGAARVAGGTLEAVRMAFGAVAPTVARNPELEQMLTGMTRSDIDYRLPGLLKALEVIIRPIDDVRSNRQYRLHVALGMAEHFIKEGMGL